MADDAENDDQWLYGDNFEQEAQLKSKPEESEPKATESTTDEVVAGNNKAETEVSLIFCRKKCC